MRSRPISQQQSRATQEIARSVQAAAQATQPVSANIAGVGEAVNHTGQPALVVRQASQTIGQQFAQLNSELDDFPDCIRAG
jgi:methyl-accepting chemotaxis protein